MVKIIRNIIGIVFKQISFFIFKYNVFYKKNVIIDNTVKLYFSEGNLDISNDVVIGAYTVIYAIDSSHSSKKGMLKIGRNTSIGEFNNLRAAGGSIVIGDNCLISQFVTIVASNHNIERGKNINSQGWDDNKTGVIIGNDVWIGANCVILPGVEIGNGCVIAAGSIITKNMSENSIVMGAPGRVVKER
jgi:acetyltransferase-like isoleucine patch superfamily enzyme